MNIRIEYSCDLDLWTVEQHQMTSKTDLGDLT